MSPDRFVTEIAAKNHSFVTETHVDPPTLRSREATEALADMDTRVELTADYSDYRRYFDK